MHFDAQYSSNNVLLKLGCLHPWPWPLSSSGLELDFEDGDGEEGCSGAEGALSGVGFNPDSAALRRTVVLRFHKVP